MGFLSDLGKAFMGKPLGPEGNTQSAPQTAPQQTTSQQQGIHDERGLKIIPEIEVKNVRSHRNGDRLRVTGWIENKSDQHIRIDETRLIDQARGQNRFLSPRASYEFVFYEGKIPDDDNRTKAQITYRLQVNGDVFMESYRVEYDPESDGKQLVTDLIDEGPVRDI